MNNDRINEIDLLRFGAALVVVFFHYSFRGHAADALSPMAYPALAPIAMYGFLGVELFFMVSGFVILMTVPSGNLRSFLVSRAVRLYPAFWTCSSITFVATLLIGGATYKTSLGQYVANLTLFHSFAGIEGLDGSYWSLGVEIQFYAMVAVVLWADGIRRAELWLSLWLLVSIVLEALNFLPGVWRLKLLVIGDYSAYFIAGAFFFILYSQGVTRRRLFLILCCLVLAIRLEFDRVFAFDKHFNVTLNHYVIAGIVSSFFALVLAIALRKTGALGRKRWLVLGGLTYPLYLLHQNLGFMMLSRMYLHINENLALCLTLAFMLLLAYLVNQHVERRYGPALKEAIDATLDRRRASARA